MRTPLIAGNWKMNTTVAEAIALVKAMRPDLVKISGVEELICPPFVSLTAMKEVLKDSSIKLGAQNLYFVEKGAYTGEISPLMLRGLCDYVIIGHSERRQYFNETGDLINKKVRAALNFHIKPILCVGERLEQNEAGKTEQVIRTQLEESLKDITNLGDTVIAYEPVWAIGTGKAATGEQANKTIFFIRCAIAELTSDEVAQGMRILYGGSITEANIAEFIKYPDIDGALVGGASLKAPDFTGIVAQTARAKA